MKVTYKVRALDAKGNVEFKHTYRYLPKALEAVERKVEAGLATRIVQKVQREEFTIEPNNKWGIRPHDTWAVGASPISTIFIHTSVTQQLSALALPRQERGQMRSVDAIAHGRGYNGISYSFGVFPSGRAYEGRGFLVVEAATEGYNTSADSICTIGNTDVFSPTEAQIAGIVAIIKEGQRRGHYAKKISVRPHRAVAAKACPGAKFPDSLLDEIQRRVNK